MPARRIGEILISEGVLTEAVLSRALGYQRVSGEHVRLGTILLNWDLLAEEGLLQALARYHRVEAAPWTVLSHTPTEVTRLVSPAMAIRLGAFPFAASRTDIHVAFLEPSNLAAADEVSAVTNRRVIPAIALEIRLLQAHQKYYGRHIPSEYRAIVQKLEKRATRVKPLDPQKAVDFRLRDIAEADSSEEPSAPPPPPGIRNPPIDLGRAPLEHGPRGTPIRVSRGLEHADLNREALPTIEIPEMPKLNPPPPSDRFSDTNPLSGPMRGTPKAGSLSDTHPAGRTPAEETPAPAEKSAQRLDDTRPKRMGARFASLPGGRSAPPEAPEIIESIDFHPEPPPVRPDPPRRREGPTHAKADGDDTLPRGASAHLAARDSVADMWRPAKEKEEAPGDDTAVSRMWTPSVAELEASMIGARSRDAIGEVALDTLLADLPRVILLGCGKSAVTGWQGRGKGITAPFLSSLRIPLAGDTVFASIQASGVPHFGPLDPVQWPPELAEPLGQRSPDCAIFPIRILEGIAGFLYADRLGEPMHYEDFAVIARAAAATANALARFLLRSNTTAPVS